MLVPKHAEIIANVQTALAEDIGTGDVTSALLPPDLVVSAMIISREPMLICGQPWVDCVFAEVNADIQVQWFVEEGAWLSQPTTLCQVHGLAHSILTAERTALNFLQTLSATATQTRAYVNELKGYKTQILDTRKTIPGLRFAQKYAVSCGGGVNHRHGLHDAFLIKENHIKACGSITAAIALAKKTQPNLWVEVEVESLEELKEALQAKPNRILLDNFSHAALVEAVAINQSSRCLLEASGGINLATIAAVAQTGVDYIAVGEITKSVQAIDLSLLIQEVS